MAMLRCILCALAIESMLAFSTLRNRQSFLAARRPSNGLVISNFRLRQSDSASGENFSSVAKKGKGKKTDADVSIYSKTVLLPQTTFNQRANSLIKEPELQKWWTDNKVYERVALSNTGKKFILHDGPPYANGNLHIGHAMNKILKDFINKYQIQRGRKVTFVPGWDCHGLPIELKVLQSMKGKEREALTPITLRKKAAEFAKETMASQRSSFQRYGVFADWTAPYLTLQPEYEAAQIRVFGEMVTKGHIYRGKKPVHWSPSSRTALAEAELEYPDNHISQSIYVGFPVKKLSSALEQAISGTSKQASDLRVAIWTTTPWTIPANLAVAVNAELIYCLAHHPMILNDAWLLVAKDLVPSLGSKFGLEEGQSMVVEKEFKGEDLVGTEYQHPLYDRSSPVVAGGDYITTDSGTGLVHTAPGHGQEDYQTGLKYGLPLLSPVNDEGCFTQEVGERFAGMSVLAEGNTEIIKALSETGALLMQEAYNHKYPYDWRTKKPTIFRATEQWFASVGGFRQNALDEIEKVQWIPAVGKNRISAMTSTRGDWCISRQRSWGVPIPVFYNKNTNEPLMTPETLKHIENIFRKHGSDAWWEMDLIDLLPEGPLRDQAGEYSKGTDTMDVWFDSGTSWAGVMQTRDLGYPADVYLEGSDQHRGWFQSSLLTSVASQGIAPYKTVLTHGFVLDEKGYKMSKSLGNVVDPVAVIEGGGNQKTHPAFGADTLRLWVSGVDYSTDVCLGSNIMKQVSENYRKIRNTMRYLLGSLSDFNAATDAVPYENLPSIDKYMLGRLSRTVQDVEAAFDNYQFYKANQDISTFVSVDLSSFYLDIAKDRLYISSKDDARRRSCQTVIAAVLEQLAVLLSPILSHLSEEVWQAIPYLPQDKSQSVFEKGWMKADERHPIHDEKLWSLLRSIRNDVNKCIEVMRQDKEVGASQECRVYINVGDQISTQVTEAMMGLTINSNKTEIDDEEVKTKSKEYAKYAQDMLTSMQGDTKLLAQPQSTNGIDDLRFVFMVSQVNVVDNIQEVEASCPQASYRLDKSTSESGLTVGVRKAAGHKCDRCWYYSESVGEDQDHPDLCLRCGDVVKTDHPEVKAPTKAVSKASME